jgi:hypothetical protein
VRNVAGLPFGIAAAGHFEKAGGGAGAEFDAGIDGVGMVTPSTTKW